MSEMNKKVEEPQDQPSDRPAHREVSPEELQKILEAHRKWVESEGKEGERVNLRWANLQGADLREANLQGADLSGAHLQGADLRGANLQEANLHWATLTRVKTDLWEANLQRANLQGAYLRDANLQRAILGEANLQDANVREANFQGAYLGKANLQGADLQNADLQRAILEDANLQGAYLLRANLRGASLRDANLQRAILGEANLQDANVREANFQGADLTGVTLHNATLTKAKLQRTELTEIRGLAEANLLNANLEGATGLLGTEFAGADVTGTRLPEDIRDFKVLQVIEEASKNTKRIFLAMLLGCAYSVLTIFSTTDARLLTNSSSSPLPIIQTPIPIAGFFGVAPAILLAVFLYFHFYLQRLWEGLSQLPAIFPDGRPLDQRAYPWLLNALVRSHFTLLREKRPPISRLQTGVSILLAWWAVPFTIGLFWIRSLQRHDWLLTGFLMAFLVLSIVWAVWFQQLAKLTLRGKIPEGVRFKGNWRRVQPYKEAIKRNYKFGAIGVIVLFFAFGVSYGAINGTPSGIIPKLLPYVGARAFADTSEKEVSTKPPNWFRDGELPRLVRGAQLNGADLRHVNALRTFLVNADLRWAKLQKADLGGANLQGADLGGANLQGAHLRGANLQGAELGGANLQKANLVRANLQGADLVGAEGLIASQVKTADNWQLAFYSVDFLKKLGLPPDHNERVKKKLAELEKDKKATGGK